jgi:hypothetical protein
VKALIEEIADLFDWNEQQKKLEVSTLLSKGTPFYEG